MFVLQVGYNVSIDLTSSTLCPIVVFVRESTTKGEKMGTYEVSQDGETLATFDSELDAFVYVLRAQSFSVDYACKYHGWAITKK